MTHLKERVDVLVAGGGPAGMAAAIRVRQWGLSVAVIEKADYSGIKIGETLPPEIQRPLSKLGLWGWFRRLPISESPATLSAWGGDCIQSHDFLFSPYGSGWHIDRSQFERSLADAAENSGVRVYRNAKIRNSWMDERKQWKLLVDSGAISIELTARFAIDATGVSSSIARTRGARRIRRDHLIAVALFFGSWSSRTIAESATLIEAVESGWWYSAVLPNGRLIAVWMTDADLYSDRFKNDPQCAIEALRKTHYTASRTSRIAMNEAPKICAAVSSNLDCSSQENWIAVGDAKVSMDPLAGQGVYRAMISGIKAADDIFEAIVEDRWIRNNDVTFRLEIDRYLLARERHYSIEQRWSNSLFWCRRRRSRNFTGSRNV